MSHITFSLFQILSTKHCKLCSWEIFLLVNLFIWAWRVCCGEFWLVHGVNWTPPRKGVVNPISDWLMHFEVVGRHCDIEWVGGVAKLGHDVKISVTAWLVTRSHMWKWVRRTRDVFCYVLFFCCFENSFVFLLFVFYLSCECDAWHKKSFSVTQWEMWCKKYMISCVK